MPLVLAISLLALFVFWYINYRDLKINEVPQARPRLPPRIVVPPRIKIEPMTIPPYPVQLQPSPQPPRINKPIIQEKGNVAEQHMPRPPPSPTPYTHIKFQESLKVHDDEEDHTPPPKMKRINTGYVFNPPPIDEDDDEDEDEDEDDKINQAEDTKEEVKIDEWEADSLSESDTSLPSPPQEVEKHVEMPYLPQSPLLPYPRPPSVQITTTRPPSVQITPTRPPSVQITSTRPPSVQITPTRPPSVQITPTRPPSVQVNQALPPPPAVSHTNEINSKEIFSRLSNMEPFESALPGQHAFAGSNSETRAVKFNQQVRKGYYEDSDDDDEFPQP